MSDGEDEAIHLRLDDVDFHAFQAPKRAKSRSANTETAVGLKPTRSQGDCRGRRNHLLRLVVVKFRHFLIEVLRPEVGIVCRHRNQHDHTVTNREDETIFSGIVVTCRCLTTAFTS